MTLTFEQIAEQAMALCSDERHRLLELLVDSRVQNVGEAPLGASWSELRQRILHSDDGEETIPAEEVFAKSRETRS